MMEFSKQKNSINIKVSEEATILQVEEDYIQMRDFLTSNTGKCSFEIDCSKVKQLDSAYLQLLLVVVKELKTNGQLYLVRASPDFDAICSLYGISLVEKDKHDVNSHLRGNDNA